jgi:hypothetical protein
VSSLNAPFAYSAEEEDYDRLDGVGKSGKKVNVIEWEGNLEVHVYPVGSLRGLALKLDKRDKNRPVMVIGYRFDNSDKPIIRRAILGIEMKEGFKTYRDKSADDYDKIVISNNTLSDQVAPFKLDPEPTQLYPDGHPANKKPEPAKTAAAAGKAPKGKAATSDQRVPASSDKSEASDDAEAEAPRNTTDDEGRIKPFFQ